MTTWILIKSFFIVNLYLSVVCSLLGLKSPNFYFIGVFLTEDINETYCNIHNDTLIISLIFMLLFYVRRTVSGLIVIHIHLHKNGLRWVTPDTFWKLLWFHVTEMHKPSQIWAQADGKEVYMDGLTSQRSGKWCVWLQLLEALNKYHNPNLFPQFQYSFVINTNVRWSTETWFIKTLIICFLLCHIL